MKYLYFLIAGMIFWLAGCSCEKCAECSNAKLGSKEKFCNKEPQAVQDWQYDKRKSSPYIECKSVEK